jgi:hypothetical protein
VVISVNAKYFNEALKAPTCGDLAIVLQGAGLQRGDAYSVAKDLRSQNLKPILGVQVITIALPDHIEIEY